MVGKYYARLVINIKRYLRRGVWNMCVYCILVGTDLYYIQENILASLEFGDLYIFLSLRNKFCMNTKHAHGLK